MDKKTKAVGMGNSTWLYSNLMKNIDTMTGMVLIS